MAIDLVSRNTFQNPDPEKDGLLEDDITYPQEMPLTLNQLPKSPLAWQLCVVIRIAQDI